MTAGAGTRVSAQVPSPNPAFDFDTGNSGIEVIIPTVIPALFQTTPPNDAPIVLRLTTVITNAWFDAIAPYHPTAVGVYSRLGRRPAAEAVNNRQKNIAMFYASYRALNSLLPRFAGTWRAMMTSVGLDPCRLWNPSRWQPLIGTPGNGTFAIQQSVTPQWARTRPYSYDSPERFRVAVPRDSNVLNVQAYKAQADEVMASQAGLTDGQKMLAELFDNKIASLGFAALFITQSRGRSLDEFVHYDFLTNAAAFDGGIATWKDKYKYDAVRPVSAIRLLNRNRVVSGWGGPGRGTVNDLPGREWRSYLNTGNHPEYPSGSSCFCAANAQASRRYFGSDTCGWSVNVEAGSSVVEPGVTPAQDLTLGPWNTFTKFEAACSQSRVLGGVHCVAATEEAAQMCKPIGDLAFEFVDRHVKDRVR